MGESAVTGNTWSFWRGSFLSTYISKLKKKKEKKKSWSLQHYLIYCSLGRCCLIVKTIRNSSSFFVSSFLPTIGSYQHGNVFHPKTKLREKHRFYTLIQALKQSWVSLIYYDTPSVILLPVLPDSLSFHWNPSDRSLFRSPVLWPISTRL